jgi:hypothetical protein
MLEVRQTENGAYYSIADYTSVTDKLNKQHYMIYLLPVRYIKPRTQKTTRMCYRCVSAESVWGKTRKRVQLTWEYKELAMAVSSLFSDMFHRSMLFLGRIPSLY